MLHMAYSILSFYSRVWHQLLRKPMTGHANYVAKQLRLPKNTFTNCFKLFIAFFVSGLIHYGVDYAVRRKWSSHSMEFFLIQAVAITCEDAIIALADMTRFSSKLNIFFKFMGFIWVLTWFTYSIPMWLDEMIQAGATDSGGWNVSLILGLNGHQVGKYSANFFKS